MKHHFLTLAILTLAACRLVAVEIEPKGEKQDPYSHLYEKALTVTAQFNVSQNSFNLTIHNTSESDVTFNKPALLPAGNIYLNADNGSSYPGVGSCILGSDPVALSMGKNTSFQYAIQNGALRITTETKLSLRLVLDSVNGEKKRTPFTCYVEIVGE